MRNNLGKLRLAYDSSGITCPGSGERGIGRYALCHLNAILREFPAIEVSVIVQSDRDLSRLASLQNFRNVTLVDYQDFQRKDYDVLHLPDPMSMMHVCIDELLNYAGEIPTTALFHDLIPIIKHQWHFDFYDTELAHNYLLRLEMLRDSITHIFTNSTSTLNDLVRIIGIPKEKCEAVYAGTILGEVSSGQRFSSKYGKYFMAVGGLDSHKGFDQTLHSYLRGVFNQGAELVIVGSSKDPSKAYYSKLLAEAGVTTVHFLGFISDQELAALYADAIGLIYPSTYEGFGFPVLEAMVCGCPVITRRNSSLEEVGGDIALYVEDDSLEGLMELLLDDERLRMSLRVRGQQHASQFTWKKVAENTVAKWQSFI